MKPVINLVLKKSAESSAVAIGEKYNLNAE